MVKVSIDTLMEISIKATGRMIVRMVKEFINSVHLMLPTKAIGKLI